MRVINNPEEFRKAVLIQLEDVLDKQTTIAVNLEKGIYNYCIKEAGEKNIVKKWDNVYFTQFYVDKMRSIITNLEKNADLRKRITQKEIKSGELAFMTHQQMNPAKWQKMLDDKKIRDENRYAPKIDF